MPGKPRSFDQNQRFRRPEFQEKLERARRFQRKNAPVPVSFWSRFLHRIGFGSVFARTIALMLLAAVIYFLTISEVFLVKEALLLGDGPSTQQLNATLKSLSKKRIYLVPKNHILIFSKSRALSALQGEFPEVKRIDFFRRVFPNKVEISLVEREPLYVWQSGPEYFFLDQDGIAFQQILSYEPAAYPEILVVDRSAKPIGPGEDLKIGGLLFFLENLKTAWPKQIFDLNFVNFEVSTPASPDVAVRTTTGFLIYFDASRDAEIQVKNLGFVLGQEIKSEALAGLSYIDLRLPAVGYYCYKDAPCALENAPVVNP